MSYTIAFSVLAEKQLDKQFIRKLTGFPYYRFRVGDYRLILDIKNELLIIMAIEIGHRRNVYK
ncbi:MAG: type II toxin-antitoxin system RelE/ParE family toxin [Candidatus Aenigmarchaeota archaeon]|nr:type II toxin-antitoxin system RelE/ParE family toxin [Candidatus Aenigmarchaeota archaeon]